MNLHMCNILVNCDYHGDHSKHKLDDGKQDKSQNQLSADKAHTAGIVPGTAHRAEL